MKDCVSSIRSSAGSVRSVVSLSDADADILKSYDLHANCYITKPVNLDRFMTVIRTVEEFWLSVVKLPPK